MEIENGTDQQILELVNQRLEVAVRQVRQANEALEASYQQLHSLSAQLQMMHEEVDSMQEELIRLRAAALLSSAAS